MSDKLKVKLRFVEHCTSNPFGNVVVLIELI